jgi:hypothetical protein
LGWTPITWPENRDDVSVIITLTKWFNYYGNSYNNLYVDSNGLLLFEKENNYNSELLKNFLNNIQISIFYGDLIANTCRYIETEDYFGFYYSGHHYFDNINMNTYEAIVKLYFAT